MYDCPDRAKENLNYDCNIHTKKRRTKERDHFCSSKHAFKIALGIGSNIPTVRETSATIRFRFVIIRTPSKNEKIHGRTIGRKLTEI